MIKLVVVFVIGLGLGYAHGYREGAAGVPSVMQRVMGAFGVYGIKDKQQSRERATDAVAP